jgi:DNA polymerase III epsilon subunit-like protein
VDVSKRQIVVDLETLSTQPNACIVSIGAVAFTIQDGITEEFFINVDPGSCKDYGLHVDPHTIEWWKEQTPQARKMWQENPVPLDEALDKFALFYGDTSIPIWGFGANFDVVILESAYTATGWNSQRPPTNKYPWMFWDIYCLRTMANVLGRRLEKTGVNHNALHDAVAETKLLLDILRS